MSFSSICSHLRCSTSESSITSFTQPYQRRVKNGKKEMQLQSSGLLFLQWFSSSAKPLISGHSAPESSGTTKQVPFSPKGHAPTLLILYYWREYTNLWFTLKWSVTKSFIYSFLVNCYFPNEVYWQNFVETLPPHNHLGSNPVLICCFFSQ